MPIKGRIDMLTTGIRTPVGLKISGADLETIEEIGAGWKRALQRCGGPAAYSPSGPASGYFLDIEWKREELARYGLSVEEAQEVVPAPSAAKT